MIIPILIMIIAILIVNNSKKQKSNVKTIFVKERKNLAEQRLVDPLLPPERTHTNRLPINIRTQGTLPNYQQVGFLYNISNSIRLPLFGRPDYRGSDIWEYYIKDNTDNNDIKIPLSKNNELYNGDVIDIPSYNGDFIAEIYELDEPRYIPHL